MAAHGFDGSGAEIAEVFTILAHKSYIRKDFPILSIKPFTLRFLLLRTVWCKLRAAETGRFSGKCVSFGCHVHLARAHGRDARATSTSET
jgi:hypothetical protein